MDPTARDPRQVLHTRPRQLQIVALAEARELALANREVARSGRDPLADRRRTDGVPTFAEAAENVIAIHSEIWRHPERTKQQWRGCLRDHAYTRIGDKAVDQVTTTDVMAVLLPLWTRRHATARKLRQRIGAVMKWAVAQGYRTDLGRAGLSQCARQQLADARLSKLLE